ncbi:GNAT family N-acetyltransferase [Arthrobacter livingstonensis]|uniref:GNAT family N-acetyltransferase n=1 Tax=Arthrobacter livingstonensis TaxID=670078 RepID=A0A2V5LSQ1_9MICC|nr:GNAT family N-acetyltransferase [Arthrobacter livingstonensis]
MRSRVAPWLASRKGAEQGPVRVLAHGDTAALRTLVARDPVANVFIDALLTTGGSAVPAQHGAVILGLFEHDGGPLASACWVGSNVVPIGIEPGQAAYFGRWIATHWQPHASIFGPADAVLGIMGELSLAGISAQEVRANQPLLVIDGPPGLDPNPALESSSSSRFSEVLAAAAAMFEEEVGYSPFLGGEENYRRRVAWLINNGHSFSHCEPDGEVIFKADLGAVTIRATQVQGVWMNPRYRGLGLSAGYMAAVVLLAQRLAPVTSLYVNDFNHRARAVYEKVGFEQVGTFATVLF